jgi:hypothetical protein
MSAPVRKIPLRAGRVNLTRRDDGSILLSAPEPLGPYPDKLTARFVDWASSRSAIRPVPGEASPMRKPTIACARSVKRS